MPPKKAAAASKGQGTLNAFIKNPAKQKVSDTDEEGESSTAAEDGPDDAGDEEENALTKDGKSKREQVRPEDSHQPPISDIYDIFSDIVKRSPDLRKVSSALNGRKLRVATMCSGTESPLLAMTMISQSMKALFGVGLPYDHVFSCEIEPFKQAYIERNFKPPILFRDVCELGDEHATNVYGSKVRVPGNVDILIAGTSCVDYSNLNNEKQDIDSGGESGKTFHGMMSWVDNHRPPVVILENVCGAPWDRVVEKFEAHGYSAEYVRVDTKKYYIPHTRTRVYLVAVNVQGSDIPGEWKNLIKSMERQASASLDAFLLSNDDMRITAAYAKMQREVRTDRAKGHIDWSRCENRHQRARNDEQLGFKRPLTAWETGGSCKVLDFCSQPWAQQQVERVWDLMDILLIRGVADPLRRYDSMYKTIVWNLSQNVDRMNLALRLGLAPCLTPTMIPFVTNRGGPITGLEALSLQGIPINEILFTRETEDQLADLAGNAMSTTVVGSVIIAALILSRDLVAARKDVPQGDEDEQMADADAMAVDEAISPAVLASRITGQDQLSGRTLDLSQTKPVDLAGLLAKSHSSRRLCTCEGRVNMTTNALSECLDCGATSCSACGGRPEHNYKKIDLLQHPRLAPADFEKELREALPMRLALTGFKNAVEAAEAAIQAARDTDTAFNSRFEPWRKALLRAATRQQVWTAIFLSPTARLELVLHHSQPEWVLYGFPEATVPANSIVRKVLAYPIARFRCGSSLFEGAWELALPRNTAVPLQIEGVGELLGLQLEGFKDTKVHSKLKISTVADSATALDRDVSGTYQLYDKCGTANGSLFKRVEGGLPGDPDLFFFLDPTRTDGNENDCFVFSRTHRRYEFGETRPIVAKMAPKYQTKAIAGEEKPKRIQLPGWRPSDKQGVQDDDCLVNCQWIRADAVSMKPSASSSAHVALPSKALDASNSSTACESARAVLICRVPLNGTPSSDWGVGEFKDVDPIHERNVYQNLSWCLNRVSQLDEHPSSWIPVQSVDGVQHSCERCAPVAPHVSWVKVKNKMKGLEDPGQAGEYEQALKHRPKAFVTQLKYDATDSTGTVQIGINPATHVHRAASRLPSGGAPKTLAYMVDTHYTPATKLDAPNPPNFKKVPLRKEQRRSLTWMISSEDPDYKQRQTFIEEEIVESVSEPLGWRILGRAERNRHVSGGVLADAVGYGKTAITLGLIDYSAEHRPVDTSVDVPGLIPVKATLVIVPPHLTRQWVSEVQKFNRQAVSIQDIEEADIVIVASNIFKSSVYLPNLSEFSAGGSLPPAEGRHFNQILDEIAVTRHEQIERLKRGDTEEIVEAIGKARQDETKRQEDDAKTAASKRLKGKQYRDAQKAKVSQNESKELPVAQMKKLKVDAIENGESKSTTHAKGPNPKLIMEVVLQRRSQLSPSASSSRSGTSGMAKSETEDEDVDVKVEKPKAGGRRSTGRASKSSANETEETANVSSDYEEDSDVDKKGKGRAVESDNDSEAQLDSDDEEVIAVPRKRKAAPAKKLAKGGKRKTKVVIVSDDEEDSEADVSDAEQDEEDEEEEKHKASRSARDEPPAKKAKVVKEKKDERRMEKRLTSASVKRNWKTLTAPPFEVFKWHRKVLDEYTYIDGKTLAMVSRLQATHQWVLSGTPPIHDFAAVRSIAAHLGIHLGVEDIGETRKKQTQQTDVEKFHAFREVRTLDWHAHRQTVAQRFLDQFVRQNVAEIDEIPWEDHDVAVRLPAAERAIYLELEHQLTAQEMTVRRTKKSESDREKRLAAMIGESTSAEEALLKRAATFDLEQEKDDAMTTCERIVKGRKDQQDACETDLKDKLIEAFELQKRIGDGSGDEYLHNFRTQLTTTGFGDSEADAIARHWWQEVSGKTLTASSKAKPSAAKAGKGKSAAKEKKEKKSSKKEDIVWELRELMHDIRRVIKELVGRVRSHRYFAAVRDVQAKGDELQIECPSCGTTIGFEQVALLSSCGHMGCIKCVRDLADKEECVYHQAGKCNDAARVTNIVPATTLGKDDSVHKGKHYGRKIEMIVDCINSKIPKSERILIFVQFADLTKKVATALTEHKVKFLEIKGSASVKSKNLELFQSADSKERVLLLNVMDESASGANLTCANHAIFISPLLAPSQEKYDANETQAIGRLRRYGQTKTVHIWRFLTIDTKDVEIFEARSGRKIVGGVDSAPSA
ncbi:hypothetical protein BKA62DRAFT_689117 [Auriculariales sp. MPI-PUGE-AT-0066]|nr:hypothetical protein BKA62DRAFT_689117 [Auriculariales sp. MPI-PUGE-AT-0066]